MIRSRIIYLLLTLATIIIGLLARRYAAYLPDMVNLGLGDALWAVMMYWIIGFIFPHYTIKKRAMISISICFAVECSQLYQADWINSIRSNRFGALVLGRGFLWSDFVAYSIGVGVGSALEYWRQKTKT